MKIELVPQTLNFHYNRIEQHCFLSTWSTKPRTFGLNFRSSSSRNTSSAQVACTKKKPPLVVYVNLGLSLRIELYEITFWSAVSTVHSIFSTAFFTKHYCYNKLLVMIHYLISSLLCILFTCMSEAMHPWHRCCGTTWAFANTASPIKVATVVRAHAPRYFLATAHTASSRFQEREKFKPACGCS